MKKVMMIIASTVLASSLALAADEESKQEVKVDHSKNPITGTETTTKTTKKKMKSPHAEAEMTKKEKTKTYKDGTKKTTTDTETTQETK